MTTAEKKRILNTQTVTGELLIREKYKKYLVRTYTIPFKENSTYRGENGYVCVTYHQPTILNKDTVSIHVTTENKYLCLWIPVTVGNKTVTYLEKRIPYCGVTILWAKYEGEKAAA